MPRTLFLLCGLLMLSPSPASADRLEKAFSLAAKSEGDIFRVARLQVVAQGKAAIPFLREQLAKGKGNWRGYWTAKSCLQHIEEARVYNRWSYALQGPRVLLRGGGPNGFKIGLYQDRNSPQDAEYGLVAGMEIPLDAVVAAVDVLRSKNRSARWTSLQVVGHYLEDDLVELVLRYGIDGRDQVLTRAMKRLTPAALPKIHELLLKASETRSVSNTGEAAVRAMKHMGTAESMLILLGLFKDPAWKREQDDVIKTLTARTELVEPAPLLDALAGPGLHFYGSLREVFLQMGERALPVLNSVAENPKESARRRAIAAGVAYEISHPEVMAEVYRKHAPILSKGRRDPAIRATERVAAQRDRWWRGGREVESPVLWPDVPNAFRLESAAVVQAFPLLRPLSDNEVARQLLREGVAEAIPSSVSLAVEVLGMEALPVLNDLYQARGARVRDLVLGALLRLGGEEGSALADQMEDYEPAGVVAAALRGGEAELRALIESEVPTLRFSAVLAALNRGNLGAVPKAFEMILAIDPRDRDGPRRQKQLRGALEQLGKKGIDPIRQAARKVNGVMAVVVAEGLVYRIENPEGGRSFDRAARLVDIGSSHQSGPELDDYIDAGKRLAERVGEDGILLLREAVARSDQNWSGIPPLPSVAALALAELKDTDSLPVIAFGAHHMRTAFVTVRGDPRKGRQTVSRHQLGAVALQRFGEAGIELAKAVPPPQPDRALFSARAGRHRAATEVLQGADSTLAVEKVLEGLKLAAEGNLQPEQTKFYLRHAGQHDNPEFIDPVVRIFERDANQALWITGAMYKYEDPRLVPAFLECAKNRPRYTPAWRGLARNKKEKTLAYLLDRLGKERDLSQRGLMVSLLGEFSLHGSAKELRKFEVSADELAEMIKASRDELIKFARTKHQPVEIRKAAALALVKRGRDGKDAEVVAALTDYVTGVGDREDGTIVYAILESGLEEHINALSLRYRSNPLFNEHWGVSLARAGRTEILPEMMIALKGLVRRKGANLHDQSLIKTACRFKDEGLKALLALTEELPDHPELAVAVYSLSVKERLKPPYSKGEALFKKLVTDPEANQGLIYSLARSLCAIDGESSYPLMINAVLSAENPESLQGLFAMASPLADRYQILPVE